MKPKLKTNKRIPISPELVNNAKELQSSGYSTAVIARTLRVSITFAHKLLNTATEPPPPDEPTTDTAPAGFAGTLDADATTSARAEFAAGEIVPADAAAPLANSRVLNFVAEADAKWEKARRYIEAATLFQRASLAAQIMAGMVLEELRKEVEMRRGKRTDLNFSQNGRSWDDQVKEKLGLSHSTAYRWMEMAREARRRLKKSDFDLGAILEKNPGALTAPEQEMLKNAVHKISDGKTQMDFMDSLGVTKLGGGKGAPRGGWQTQDKGGEESAEGAADATGEDAAAPEVQQWAKGERLDPLTGKPIYTGDMEPGWCPVCYQVNALLEECLANNWWNDCDDAQRAKLHGNLLDAQRALGAMLGK